ncbi:hypothetical protein C499_02918 [Halogeometricum borinquense DSM 11551]|uniref:Uncharacterized protein n=1 Tax=Halogeometricum borinquense (strain ATCC 700274 / DSM 11551 / JCM 10706 / KCTC 4070 / PR3) TaxID=469382 RepID=L9V1G5_HALBP|nr:hypothetical protein C499_02918 [Halogeometricum borinquense DSM 11551]
MFGQTAAVSLLSCLLLSELCERRYHDSVISAVVVALDFVVSRKRTLRYRLLERGVSIDEVLEPRFGKWNHSTLTDCIDVRFDRKLAVPVPSDVIDAVPSVDGHAKPVGCIHEFQRILVR